MFLANFFRFGHPCRFWDKWAVVFYVFLIRLCVRVYEGVLFFFKEWHPIFGLKTWTNPLTLQNDLHKILGGHLAVACKTLVGSSIALCHALHYKVLIAETSDAGIWPWLDPLSISVPSDFIFIRTSDTAEQRHLTAHAGSHLTRTHHCLQGLWRGTSIDIVKQISFFFITLSESC